MKVIVKETEGEGLESLLGQNVLLFCLNYIYAGELIGVNDTCVKLKGPLVVYETGAFSDKNYRDAQPLHTDVWYVKTGTIESFGLSK